MTQQPSTTRRMIFWVPTAIAGAIGALVLVLAWSDGITLSQGNGAFLTGVYLLAGGLLLNVAPVLLFLLWLVTLCNRETLARDLRRWSSVAFGIFITLNVPLMHWFTAQRTVNYTGEPIRAYAEAFWLTLDREAAFGWPLFALAAAVGGFVLSRAVRQTPLAQ